MTTVYSTYILAGALPAAPLDVHAFLPRLAAQWAGGLAASAAVWLAWVQCTHGWRRSS